MQKPAPVLVLLVASWNNHQHRSDPTSTPNDKQIVQEQPTKNKTTITAKTEKERDTGTRHGPLWLVRTLGGIRTNLNSWRGMRFAIPCGPNRRTSLERRCGCSCCCWLECLSNQEDCGGLFQRCVVEWFECLLPTVLASIAPGIPLVDDQRMASEPFWYRCNDHTSSLIFHRIATYLGTLATLQSLFNTALAVSIVVVVVIVEWIYSKLYAYRYYSNSVAFCVVVVSVSHYRIATRLFFFIQAPTMDSVESWTRPCPSKNSSSTWANPHRCTVCNCRPQ